MPVFLFDVLDPAPPLSPGEAAFTGFAQWVVLHDSQHEASAAIARHLPKATALPNPSSRLDPARIAALQLVKDEPRLYE
jgi:hypothetical protein